MFRLKFSTYFLKNGELQSLKKKPVYYNTDVLLVSCC